MPNGKTILENALSPFLEDIECQRVIVAVSDEDLKKITFEKKMIFARNGKERFFSVYNALKEVKEEYVMIHDGARPYITSLDLANLKETLKSEDAAMLGIKAKDTIKEVKDGYVLKTLDRDHIYLAQTPQCFKSSLIKEAYLKGYEDQGYFTDDASVLESYFKTKIKMVNSTTANNKITFIDDIR